ncbi:UV DNA damage repair endonuclease UvsE [Paenibacillus sp. MBLB4367]|uniref:UV DNA damage repair endonuclease UvsE n=1 Tax=Paenibacillus sp. MBLB4367 TaxID=3384767 RepID=UPI0039082311
MIVRFGYVAMSTVVQHASPSRTMTATRFAQLPDREAAIRKLERIAAENLQNTLRLLRHNRAHDIRVYRFSSKLIPLFSHELLAGWDPFPVLAEDFAAIGEYVKENGMRTSFHPDHFTVLSTPRPEVLRSSAKDLDTHVRMLEAMGLDESAKCNIHIGGSYGDKPTSFERFCRQFGDLEPRIKRRMTLENDDKTYTALETLTACERVRIPMVLDLHHHTVNNEGTSAEELWPRIRQTWQQEASSAPDGEQAPLPPKIHVSSPKNEKDFRAHAEYVDASPLLAFLQAVACDTPRLDVMLEAKMKDSALFRLMRDLTGIPGVKPLGAASVEIG